MSETTKTHDRSKFGSRNSAPIKKITPMPNQQMIMAKAQGIHGLLWCARTTLNIPHLRVLIQE